MATLKTIDLQAATLAEYGDGATELLLTKSDGENRKVNIADFVAKHASAESGYLGLLSPFYFGGSATATDIPVEGVGVWTDVVMTIDVDGDFDYRTDKMKLAQSSGFAGSGSLGDPVTFTLEGLTIESFANFRASMSFEPDEDGGQLETRLLFSRHSGTSPSADFSIEEVTLSMSQGADLGYTAEPLLSFFVGDSIDTNAAGDAGTFKFQVKTNVAGTVSMRALTLYMNQ